eukprot:scaffold70183_cov19-Tisochrysis_lutea.AAC.2
MGELTWVSRYEQFKHHLCRVQVRAQQLICDVQSNAMDGLAWMIWHGMHNPTPFVPGAIKGPVVGLPCAVGNAM